MMRRKKNILMAALMMATCLISCTENGVRIKGAIEMQSPNEETHISILIRNPLINDTCHFTVSPEGTFDQTLPIKEERELYLMVNGRYIAKLLAEEGDFIELTWQSHNPSETLEFADPARKREQELEKLLNKNFSDRLHSLASLSPRPDQPYDTTLIDGIEKYVNEYRQAIEDFEQEHGALPHKRAFLINGYFNALAIAGYSPEAIEHLKLRGLRSGLPEDTVAGKAAYEVMPARDLAHIGFREFLWKWTHYTSRKQTGPADSLNTIYKRYFERMDTTFHLVQNREIAEWVLAYRGQFAKFELQLNEALTYLRHLDKNLSYPWTKEYVKRLISQLNPFQSGIKAPEFRMTDEEGKAYTLADFHGKYLYIGFWSRTCRVCHKEFKNIAALREKYQSYDDRLAYVFAYVGKEDDKKWSQHIDQYGSRQGINLRTTEQDQKAYDITGFPTYILIDPNGKIVEYNTARPSKLLQEGENVLDKALGIR